MTSSLPPVPLARLAALFLSLPALTGCGVSGERAGSGCPDGEICSDATPKGLRFFGSDVTGAVLGSAGLAPVAVDGTQSIRVEAVGSYTLPIFDALSAGPAFEVTAIDGTRITITGQEAGQDLLRVVDESDGGSLLDRIELESAVATHAVAASADTLALFSAPTRRNAVFAPGEQRVAIHLLDAQDRVLVDTSMALSLPALPEDARDARTVTLVDEALSVGVDAAGQHFEVAIAVAPPIDGLELIDWALQTGPSGLPQLGANGTVCVVGLAGDSWVIGQAADPSFALDGVALEAAADQVTTFCATLPAETRAGEAELVVSVGAVSAAFEVELTAGSTGDAGAALAAPTSPRALGERARGAI